MELKGTKTEENLKTAFAGESQAHTKYLYYVLKAKSSTTHNFAETAKQFEKFKAQYKNSN